MSERRPGLPSVLEVHARPGSFRGGRTHEGGGVPPGPCRQPILQATPLTDHWDGSGSAPDQVPWKPIAADAPGARAAFQSRLVAVTRRPSWCQVAFQPLVSCGPSPTSIDSVHPCRVADPELVKVTWRTKPPGHSSRWVVMVQAVDPVVVGEGHGVLVVGGVVVVVGAGVVGPGAVTPSVVTANEV